MNPRPLGHGPGVFVLWDLTLISTTAPGAVRHYDSGRALLQDVVNARVWNGFHFRSADIASRDLARQLAAWTLDHYFQPR